MRERADRVESEHPHSLEPDLRPDVLEDIRLVSGSLEDVRDFVGPLSFGPVQLADWKPIAIQVPDHARSLDLRSRVGDATEDSLGLDVRCQAAVGIQAVEAPAVQLAAVPLEVPPGEAVLDREHDRVRSVERPHVLHDIRYHLRLHGQDDQIVLPRLLEAVGRPEVADDALLAVVRSHLEAVAADRVEVLAHIDERHLLAREREVGAHESANGPRPHHTSLHGTRAREGMVGALGSGLEFRCHGTRCSHC